MGEAIPIPADQGTGDSNENWVETWPKSLSGTNADQMVHLTAAG